MRTLLINWYVRLVSARSNLRKGNVGLALIWPDYNSTSGQKIEIRLLIRAGVHSYPHGTLFRADCDGRVPINRNRECALHHLSPEPIEVRPAHPVGRPTVLRVGSPGHHTTEPVLPFGEQRVAQFGNEHD